MTLKSIDYINVFHKLVIHIDANSIIMKGLRIEPELPSYIDKLSNHLGY